MPATACTATTQRACGRSSRERPWTLDRFVRDLDAVRAHFGYERWLVGGHSFGADLALRYACAYPERTIAVVYVAGVGIAWTTYRAAFGEAVTARRPADDECRYRELSDRDRTDAEEREFRILSWTTDYIDPAVGKANAAVMADSGRSVNYELNRILGASRRRRARRRAPIRAGRCRRRRWSCKAMTTRGRSHHAIRWSRRFLQCVAWSFPTQVTCRGWSGR